MVGMGSNIVSSTRSCPIAHLLACNILTTFESYPRRPTPSSLPFSLTRFQNCGIDAFLKGEGGKVGEAIYVGTALDQVDDNKVSTSCSKDKADSGLNTVAERLMREPTPKYQYFASAGYIVESDTPSTKEVGLFPKCSYKKILI